MKSPRARPPKAEEIDALLEFLVAEDTANEGPAMARDTIAGFIRSAGIAVIDHYITDGPGYAGRVMFVVWPAGPETHEVFTFDMRSGKLMREESLDRLELNRLKSEQLS